MCMHALDNDAHLIARQVGLTTTISAVEPPHQRCKACWLKCFPPSRDRCVVKRIYTGVSIETSEKQWSSGYIEFYSNNQLLAHACHRFIPIILTRNVQFKIIHMIKEQSKKLNTKIQMQSARTKDDIAKALFIPLVAWCSW